MSPTTRGLLVFVACWVCLVHLLAVATAGVARPQAPGLQHWSPQMSAAETPLSRWDSRWFFTVATEGYYTGGSERESPVRFYPLYPMLMAGTAGLTRLGPLWAGTLVSVLAVFGSALLLGWAGRASGGEDGAFGTVQALLFFPSAFILATVYSDGLALVAVLAAVMLARSGRWWWAGLAGAAACLTRMNACLVLLPLSVLAVSSWRSGRRWPPLFALVLTLAGAATFPLYLRHQFGDLFLYFHTHPASWSQHPRFFVSFLWDVLKAVASAVTGGPVPREIQTMPRAAFPVNVAVLALMFWTLVATLRKRKWDEAAFMAGATLLAINAGSLDSLARVALMYFPIYLRLGECLSAHRTFRSVATPLLIGTQTVLVIMFTHWWFVL